VYAWAYVAGVVASVTVTVKLYVPLIVGVPVRLSVTELAADVNVTPGGNAPAEMDHVPAVATVNVADLIAAFTKTGLVKVLGAIPVTTSV
jgi:hypothetical protein